VVVALEACVAERLDGGKHAEQLAEITITGSESVDLATYSGSGWLGEYARRERGNGGSSDEGSASERIPNHRDLLRDLEYSYCKRREDTGAC
jgi:hypothetical protein